ncbi:heterokaryon incompatibility protein-domain-containing protein [Leptodontidium sp. MPI-SDFR-AT-0119]|nr:heterokaryon incompatibility protein-domain-containing protein [Leptodontidium sp. MPI-SDFR-AT-0119]
MTQPPTDAGSPLYEPLPSPRSIRLLAILPGVDDPIRCELSVVDLETAPPYEALSYVWGIPGPTLDILCNGKAIPVGPNLYSALRHLRGGMGSYALEYDAAGIPHIYIQASTRIIWIDAICINQADSDERSKQVLFMNAIYRKAQHVTVWLGEHEGSALTAMNILRKAAGYSRLEAARNVPRWHEERRIIPADNEIAEEGFEDTAKQLRDLPHSGSPDWEAVFWLLGRPWFRRMWILQEAAVRSVFVRIGKLFLNWHDISVGATFLLKKRYFRTEEEVGKLCRVRQIHLNGLLIQMPGNTALYWLIQATVDFEATDPRDKIYALFGFLSEECLSSPLLRPNYRKSVVDVYIGVIRHLILNNPPEPTNPIPGNPNAGALGFLSMTSALKDENENDFPSWLPRWDKPDRSNRNFTTTSLILKPGASNALPPQLAESGPSRSLILMGLRITTILEINSIGPIYPSTLANTITELLDSITSKAQRYPAGGTVKEAFTLSLTGGSLKDNNNDFASFESYHEADLDDYLSYSRNGLSHSPESAAGSFGQNDHPFAHAVRNKDPFIITANGLIGRGIATVQPGDVICVLLGGKVPYVIRSVEDHYRFVGECYIPGLMNGEAIDDWNANKLSSEWIELR